MFGRSPSIVVSPPPWPDPHHGVIGTALTRGVAGEDGAEVRRVGGRGTLATTLAPRLPARSAVRPQLKRGAPAAMQLRVTAHGGSSPDVGCPFAESRQLDATWGQSESLAEGNSQSTVRRAAGPRVDVVNRPWSLQPQRCLLLPVPAGDTLRTSRPRDEVVDDDAAR
jgi:hypothetical protein